MRARPWARRAIKLARNRRAVRVDAPMERGLSLLDLALGFQVDLRLGLLFHGVALVEGEFGNLLARTVHVRLFVARL